MTEYTGAVKAELEETGAKKVGVTMGDLRLYECPLSFITDETWQMMRAVFLADGSQQLYFSGGWADQPHWFIEALEMYRAETARRMKRDGDGGKKDRGSLIGG